MRDSRGWPLRQFFGRLDAMQHQPIPDHAPTILVRRRVAETVQSLQAFEQIVRDGVWPLFHKEHMKNVLTKGKPDPDSLGYFAGMALLLLHLFSPCENVCPPKRPPVRVTRGPRLPIGNRQSPSQLIAGPASPYNFPSFPCSMAP